ncbi:sulfate ABC transporter substrate-binding protein [Nocardioides sp. GY 10127]|uniref:sulfate ABC transporter substrate-binding protein n=1 Tax=Nocardioides sp. GY 10127 TaxID=2569762 RepID=UPI0010A92568|nr:sulfate ABC transporter substrate-binding protein [Nocardioides sp. GY 10127]TIC80078.1 sulfate ABC transporter substrate-binding protein [Nocardioides sp. GY 10127]
MTRSPRLRPRQAGRSGRRRGTAALVGLVAGALLLTACGTSSDASGGDTVNVVGYSVLEQANEGVIAAFNKTEAGSGVTVKGSYGASGDQSRAVEAGLDADEVHLSLEPDVTRLVDDGLVASDWKDNATDGVCTQSIVVFVVRKGNPLGITSWSDLVKDDVSIVTPNPASSGSAKWNLLAAYGSVIADGGSQSDAESYMTDFFSHVAALPDSGRDATTAFESGTGDVLLSYENEAILARQSGADFDYVVPDSSILIQNSCALLKDASQAASDFMDFQKSKEGQTLYAETGYRPLVDVGDVTVDGANDPSNPFPDPKKLLTIDDDFGGWDKANTEFFDEDNGILTTIQASSGVS